MWRRFGILILLFVSACQQNPAAPSNPTDVPFPTMTVGQMVRGALPEAGVAVSNGSNLANPATAMALASQPTPTPDYAACPAPSDITPGDKPADERAMLDTISQFLSNGGTVARLEVTLRDDWELLGENGFVRGDLDLTGEGTPEVLAGFVTPDGPGMLVIWGCVDGRYLPLYQSISSEDAPPEIVSIGDMNYDQLTDILFTHQQCDEDDVCSYQSQLVTWKPTLGRFVNLLAGTINSESPPEIRDIDQDSVSEIVVRLRDSGNATVGPLRTGVNIYDWDGSIYTLSIVQYDPPRFTIQIIHEADRLFDRLETDGAIALYQTALNDVTLEAWYNNDPAILPSYAMYRLLLIYAYTEDDRLLDMYQRITDTYPDPENRPVYVDMSESFWNALQVTNNLHSACLEVQDIINTRPEALALLNRYGTHSPTYLPEDLCPF
jgi:hypothetical protein